MDPIISIKELKKTYVMGSEKVHALKSITLDIKKNELRNIKAFSRDGSRYTLLIEKLTPNKTFGAETFKFDATKYPGVEMEDLRVE